MYGIGGEEEEKNTWLSTVRMWMVAPSAWISCWTVSNT